MRFEDIYLDRNAFMPRVVYLMHDDFNTHDGVQITAHSRHEGSSCTDQKCRGGLHCKLQLKNVF